MCIINYPTSGDLEELEMQDEYFKETGEIKQKISKIINDLDEIRNTILVNCERQDEAKKISEIIDTLEGIVAGNIEELEHLVIVDGVHYNDTI